MKWYISFINTNKIQFTKGNYTTFQKCLSSAKCYVLQHGPWELKTCGFKQIIFWLCTLGHLLILSLLKCLICKWI